MMRESEWISSVGGMACVFFFSPTAKGPSIAGGMDRARALLFVVCEIFLVLGEVSTNPPNPNGVGGCGSTISVHRSKTEHK